MLQAACAVNHNCIDINAVSPITDKEYYVRGNTALLDAVGITINKIDSKGIALNYCVLSEAVSLFRAAICDARIDDEWSTDIQKDFKKRGGKN